MQLFCTVFYKHTHTQRTPSPCDRLLLLIQMCSLMLLLLKVMKILPQAFRGMVVGVLLKTMIGIPRRNPCSFANITSFTIFHLLQISSDASHRKWFCTPYARTMLRTTFAPFHCKSTWFHMPETGNTERAGEGLSERNWKSKVKAVTNGSLTLAKVPCKSSSHKVFFTALRISGLTSKLLKKILSPNTWINLIQPHLTVTY